MTSNTLSSIKVLLMDDHDDQFELITTSRGDGLMTPALATAPAVARVIYEINAADELVAIGADWVRFAEANEAAHLADHVVGRSLWDFISGATTRHVYRELVNRARAGQTISFDYRCDSPALRRFMRMTIIARSDGAVAFDSVTMRIEQRSAALPSLISVVGEPVLRMCSWCKRVEVSQSWEEVEIAVERLGLLSLTDPPLISHAICPPCYDRIMTDADAG